MTYVEYYFFYSNCVVMAVQYITSNLLKGHCVRTACFMLSIQQDKSKG